MSIRLNKLSMKIRQVRQSEEMHQFVKESKESYLDKAFPKI